MWSIWRRPLGRRIGGRHSAAYCMGLILPGERKCNEPIAARLEPCRVEGAHQSLHHFVANAYWSQEGLDAGVEILQRLASQVRVRRPGRSP